MTYTLFTNFRYSLRDLLQTLYLVEALLTEMKLGNTVEFSEYFLLSFIESKSLNNFKM